MQAKLQNLFWCDDPFYLFVCLIHALCLPRLHSASQNNKSIFNLIICAFPILVVCSSHFPYLSIYLHMYICAWTILSFFVNFKGCTCSYCAIGTRNLVISLWYLVIIRLIIIILIKFNKEWMNKAKMMVFLIPNNENNEIMFYTQFSLKMSSIVRTSVADAKVKVFREHFKRNKIFYKYFFSWFSIDDSIA